MVSESRAKHALPGEERRERGKKQVLMLILGCILAGYVIGRAILPLRLHWGWKIGLAVPVLLTAFKFHVLHWFGGPRFFAPELPVALLLTAACSKDDTVPEPVIPPDDGMEDDIPF